MSLIIDANCAGDALSGRPSADFVPIVDALLKGVAKLVVGGKLKQEYQRHGPTWRYLRILDQAGRARFVDDSAVDAEEERLVGAFQLRSDDPHVLALARVSGARLLCSRDQNLHADFDNPEIISDPRGYIYQAAAHRKLIKKCCGG